MSLPALKEATEGLASLSEELGISAERLEEVKDEILEAKIKSSEQLATLLNVSVPDARRILSTPEISAGIMAIFRKAMLVEIDLLEVPMLINIARAESMTPTPRMRALKRLRQILEPRKSGGTTVNVQQNVVNSEGFYEQKVRAIEDGKKNE